MPSRSKKSFIQPLPQIQEIVDEIKNRSIGYVIEQRENAKNILASGISIHKAYNHLFLIDSFEFNFVASTFYKKAGAPDWFWDMMSKPTFESMPQPCKDAFLKINPDTNALHRMYERYVARMQSFRDISEEQMKSIKAPAFIVIGDRDVTTPEHAAEMHRLISNSPFAIISG